MLGKEMADIIKTVGNGHGAPDYATLTLWEAGEEGVDPGAGFTSIAECSGYLGSGANINGAFIRGAIIRGDVTWEGTNDSSLSSAEQLTIAAGTGINVEDLRIFTNNQFVSALNYNADFILMDRVVLDNTTTGINAIDINGGFTNGHIRNFVARGGADAVMAGFNQGTNLTNGLVYGATDKGIEGSSSTPMVITNVLLFNNGGQDIDSAGGITVIDCATEDLTGTYTGYGSAELVNFAMGNLQTGSTSDLATLGSPFIGALLEASGGISLTATLGTIEYNSNDSVVSLAGSVDVTATLGTISYSSSDATISLTGSVDVIATLGVINYASNDSIIQVSGAVNVSATLGAINYTSNDTSISLFGNVDIVATLGTINYNSNDVSISLAGGVNVNATLGAIDYTSSDTTILLQGQVLVLATLGAITYDSYNVNIQVGSGQFIGTVTAGFANDIYSAGFKPSEITVNFKS
tara:strand:+ start:10733 stop:12127 length:1395 start_codon:yes stop_codon:yes gene_type:complete